MDTYLKTGFELQNEFDSKDKRIKDLEKIIYDYNMVNDSIASDITDLGGIRYKFLIENIHDLVFCIDGKGFIKYCSSPIQQISGFTLLELLGKNLISLLHPDDVGRFIAAFSTLKPGQVLKEEHRLIDKFNKIHWFCSSIKGTFQNGELYQAIGVASEITDTKDAEIALIESWERNHAILNSIPDTMIFCDRSGNFTDIYAPEDSLFGTYKAELLSKNINDAGFSEYHKNLLLNKMKLAFETGELQTVEYDMRVGSEIQYFEARLNALNENEIVAIIRDITQKKEQERLLQQSEKRFRSLFANMIEPTYVLEVLYNFNGTIKEIKILDINKAFESLTGYSHEDIVGKFVSELPKNYFITPRIELIKEVLEYGKSLKFESESPDGRFFSISVFALGYNKLATIIEDITDRKRYHSEILKSRHSAEEANKMKTNILQNLGHEFKTPLNGILGFAKLMMDTGRDTEDAEMIQCIIDSARRLERTLNSILSLSEIENKKMKPNIESFHLPSLIKSKVYQYENPIAQKKLKLDLIVNDDMAFAMVDEYLLNQIMFNLMDNAIKFTYRGGITIEIDSCIDQPDEYSVIRVKDTGIGISANSQKSIFEDFRQESEGISRSYEGIGLGLSISKKMLDLQNGKIELHSQINEGSTFTLKLPKPPVIKLASD